MQAFVWSARFETGIASVDEQHRKLVDIVNDLGHALINASTTDASLATTFDQLARYAELHFADEESLMARAGLHAQHTEQHHTHHCQFVDQLTQLWEGRADFDNPAEVLHGFLASWLTFHILEEDQAMARQIEHLAHGMSARKAYDQELALLEARDSASAVLLGAMHTLHHVLVLQNQGLVQANARLEERVARRTRELVQSAKMAAVGQLAAGVAHEINTPIGFVRSNLGTLRIYGGQLLNLVDAWEASGAAADGLPESLQAVRAAIDLAYLREDLVDLVQESQEGLDRVRTIVQSLRNFAHAEEHEVADVDLLRCLDNTLVVARSQIPAQVHVESALQPLPTVPCAEGQVNQVLMALLVNAAQAIEGPGTITLTSGSDAAGAWITVTDTGRGMDDAVRTRLFEPFFTTQPVGQGVGLGLAMAWDIIVNKHGGRMDVKSAPGQGSSFTVWLPIRHNQSMNPDLIA